MGSDSNPSTNDTDTTTDSEKNTDSLDETSTEDSETEPPTDLCPNDPNKTDPGWCGCGQPEGTCPGIEVSQATYNVEESISVQFWSLPGNILDWIALHEKSWTNDYHSFEFTYGATEGVLVFAGLPPGEYEARLHFNDSDDVEDIAPFRVVKKSNEVIVDCQADAHVSESKPAINHGISSELLATTTPTRYESYLKFNIPTLTAPIERVLFRLCSRERMNNGPSLYLTDNNWTEDGITWNNRPLPGGTKIADMEKVPIDWGQIYVTGHITESGPASIVLVPDGIEEGNFYSRQTKFGAYLVIVTSD
jgi:hypothetical protein